MVHGRQVVRRKRNRSQTSVTLSPEKSFKLKCFPCERLQVGQKIFCLLSGCETDEQRLTTVPEVLMLDVTFGANCGVIAVPPLLILFLSRSSYSSFSPVRYQTGYDWWFGPLQFLLLIAATTLSHAFVLTDG
jgi:hypothetical protein